MKIRIQRPINGIQYSVNEQEIETNGMSSEEIRNEIIKAKEISDTIQQCYGQSNGIADVQLVTEFNELKKVLEKVQTTSEQKSVILEVMKKELGDEKYNMIKESVINSDNFQKITLHSNN